MGYSFTPFGQLVTTVSQTDFGADLDMDLGDGSSEESDDPQRSVGVRLALSPVVQTLAVMTLVSLVSWSTSQAITLRYFVLSAPVDQWPETLVTSVYSHVDVNHLVGNAVIIGIAGWIINRKSSWFRFHAFFIATGAIAAVVQIWVATHIDWSIAASDPSFSFVLGASGAAFALVGYIMTGNTLGEGLISEVPLGRIGTAIALLLAAIVIAIWQSPPGSGVAAHAVGLFLGMLTGPFHILRAE